MLKKQVDENKRTISEMSGDFTVGPLAMKAFRFALPLAATGMLQQLFNATDVAIVGRFAGTNAMAAVGSNSSIVGLLINLFVGIASGVNVVVSQSIGANNPDKVKKQVHTAIILALVGGCIFLAVGQAIAGKMLVWTSVPDDIFPLALLYLRIYVIGLPFQFLYNFEASIFRSYGAPRTPLMCLSIGGVLNVFLNLLFVVVFDMGVAGVAIGTVCSNVASSLIMLVLLLRHKGIIHVSVPNLRMDGPSTRRILVIGLPTGIQMSVFSLSSIIVQSAVNQLGTDVIAATSAAFYIEVFIYYIITAFGQTCTTFVGQNYGAGKLDRCRASLRIIMIMSLCVTAVLVVIAMLFRAPLLRIFNPDPAVIEIGVFRLGIVLPMEFINCAIENLTGSLRGYGKSMVPAVISFIGVCGLRIIWVYTIFAQYRTYAALMMSFPTSWCVTFVLMLAAYFVIINRMKRQTVQ